MKFLNVSEVSCYLHVGFNYKRACSGFDRGIKILVASVGHL